MLEDTPTPFPQHILLTPGPTPIHPRAQRALLREMLGHMDPEVFALNREIQADLREMYGTAPETFTALLAGTGSLGMEAGFANLVEPGDEVLVCVNGSFGARMAEMAARYGARVRQVTAPLGEAINPADVAAQLGRASLVAVVHGETSTGVLNPLPEIADVVRQSGALLTVDAVTTAGMEPFQMQAWGIDYVYTGAQKCLSAPPGLAPVAISDRALARHAARRTPTPLWYCDFGGLRDYWVDQSYHHTVPVNLHYAFHAALRAALEEGLSARQARVQNVSQAILAALAPLGFTPYVTDRAARLPTVLALRLPAGFDDAAIRGALRAREISVTGGLGPTAGLIWRLGLMGEAARPAPYRALMTALEDLLGERGLVSRFDEALNAVPA
ncbi:alanine--glyoxylate aminotransferase family protein [Deinococcus metallilatus]|uniref:Alanine--glyoxylate aminotransferase family protein n=1 Tax=Deinococcus metallilatus TaxID=1211322 RepID=A0AAJ5JYQ2_9DEIO|nr:alanine--glyoxylate aminotransferase family protein [Deinococcus metallilatus]MBB5294116.1 alanine-glyoxylate transaminase/serine-glyoxylate transaminase/serine-pyruvate transaminase [Deinococcus metallilatus]QBY08901.1 alanine--glyoxylate aminotransferase family protein [Deinococcus metallilatus]RXJ10045.1 alanine--glyoxylate aminotransferase family protein [Deinococcus metallilatus]TLK28018.1 alanine--glyoxylate aminotransferase family protein [Deinococcus metallilatus]GMA16548.1 aminotra